MKKACRRCNAVKPVEEFHRHAHGAFGRDSICKSCSKLKTYEWRKANPGGHAKIQAKYVKKHPGRKTATHKKWREKNGLEYERARYSRRRSNPEQLAVYRSGQQAARNRRRAAGPLSAATVRDVLKDPCAYCGSKATSVDHILPVSRGGTNARENLAPACADCNRRKHAKTPSEWKEMQACP